MWNEMQPILQKVKSLNAASEKKNAPRVCTISPYQGGMMGR